MTVLAYSPVALRVRTSRPTSLVEHEQRLGALPGQRADAVPLGGAQLGQPRRIGRGLSRTSASLGPPSAGQPGGPGDLPVELPRTPAAGPGS